MNDKKKRKQIAFDVTEEMHQQVKVLAAIKNISMNLFIQRALIREINRQTRNDDNDKTC